jgi:anti-anti-sigma factor
VGQVETGMNTSRGIFEFEQRGDTIVLTPAGNLGELEYQRIESGAGAILDLLNNSSIKHMVVDFHRTDYFGTTALGFFLKLWKGVRSGGGQMVFCNLSEHELEILQLMKLDTLWTIRATRDEALAAVKA